jgi:hypothetical protein
MTPNHTGINTGPNKHRKAQITKLIEELPLSKRSLHNIRLRFRVEGLWELFHKVVADGISNTTLPVEITSPNSKKIPTFRINKKSKDIALATSEIYKLLIGVTVHKMDTRSVTVVCSLNPVAMDTKGLFNLACALTRVKERLRILIKDASKCHHHNLPNIPREQSPVQTITVPSYET